jgi:hypothetical protein
MRRLLARIRAALADAQSGYAAEAIRLSELEADTIAATLAELAAGH